MTEVQITERRICAVLQMLWQPEKPWREEQYGGSSNRGSRSDQCAGEFFYGALLGADRALVWDRLNCDGMFGVSTP